MELLIKDSRTISEVQLEFNKEFPFLKIEFFDEPYQPKKAMAKSRVYPHDRKLANCRRKHNEGLFNISSADEVRKVEGDLWQNFGLSVQIFRKSGNLWIETSLTDSWTLEQQNREGLELSGAPKSPYKEAEDLDLTDRDKWE
jgi:hypothetical protein